MNAALVAKPEAINKDPHGEAWMIVLKIADPAGVGALMDAAAYQALVDERGQVSHAPPVCPPPVSMNRGCPCPILRFRDRTPPGRAPSWTRPPTSSAATSAPARPRSPRC